MDKLFIPGDVYLSNSNEFKDNCLLELENKKVVVFISKTSSKRLKLDDWLKQLKSISSTIIINEINTNPTYIDIYNSLNLLKGFSPQIVLAIGGGSSIDMAKASVGLLYLNDCDNLNEDIVLDAIKTKSFLNHESNIEIFAVPTTAGTGSEVTRWATVWDMKNKAKYSVDAPFLYPKKAFIIPEFTLSMPKRLTLSTALDALSQAIEAYWAKSTNLMVKELSKSAIRLIVEYLPKVLSNPSDLYLRKKLFLGSLFSGLAFSNTRTTACHSISYPLTMKFNVEHGLACIMTIPQVLEINKDKIEGLEELYSVLNIKDSKDLQTWLDKISKDIVNLKLTSFNIEEKDIEELVDLSFTLGRMDNNPVAIEKENVKKILINIL